MPPILRRLAPTLGAVVEFEPDYEVVGLIRFPNGRQSYFWHNKFNLNSVSSARIAQDKGYASYFLARHGFQVPQSGVFLEDGFRRRIGCGDGMDAARAFASTLNWQVFLKPLRGSGGAGIVRICSEHEYDAVAPEVFAIEKKVLLQRACLGRDFRIVVLDGEVINAYERLPLTVTGDGTRSIAELLVALQQEFVHLGRDTIISVNDPRIAQVLLRNQITSAHVLPVGQAMRLLDVANLSCGGTTRVVTDCLHPETALLAARVAAAMDLRLAGVDILLTAPSTPPDGYMLLEVNSAPGLDHYGASGPTHEACVDELYMKVLIAISNGPPTSCHDRGRNQF